MNSLPVWWAIFLGAAAPLGLVLWRVVTDDLGADPAKTLVEYLGTTALTLLLITLALTPLKQWAGFAGGLRYRRMLGLYSFVYALLHLASYWLFLADWRDIWADLSDRTYILVGFLAFLILLALAITSPRWMVRRLGRNWKRLHRLVYLAAGLALLHFVWQARGDLTEPFLYILVFVYLMLARWRGWRSPPGSDSRPPPVQR